MYRTTVISLNDCMMGTDLKFFEDLLIDEIPVSKIACNVSNSCYNDEQVRLKFISTGNLKKTAREH